MSPQTAFLISLGIIENQLDGPVVYINTIRTGLSGKLVTEITGSV